MLNIRDEPEPSKPRYVYITSYLNKNIAEEIYEFLLDIKANLKVEVFLKPHPATKELFTLSDLPQQYHIYPKEKCSDLIWRKTDLSSKSLTFLPKFFFKVISQLNFYN